MGIDREVAEALAVLDREFPTVEHMSAADARQVIAARRQQVVNADDVRQTDDREILTPEGAFRVRLYRPHGDRPLRPAVLFFHGGGFVFCDIDTHDGFCRAMARHTGAVVVSVGYRLAPESPAPAAGNDAFAALCWTVERASELGIDPRRVVLAGDSAGGNLAAVTALRARDAGGPPIAGQVLIYPVIAAEFDSESHRTHGTGFFITTAALRWYWQQYLAAGVPAQRDYVEPLRARTHAGLPPAVVITAGLDPLHSEGQRYVEALGSASVPVVHRHYPGLFHGFLTILTLTAAQSARRLLWSDMNGLIRAGKDNR